MDVSKYLQRIGFTGTIQRDYDTLARLQACHQMAVPFENLEAMAGKRTDLKM